MKATLDVPSLGWQVLLKDALMLLPMYVGSGALREAPQRTHRWNWKKLTKFDVCRFSQGMMVHCEGIRHAIPRGMIRYHIPILGGWRDYVVLQPREGESWYVGWITADAVGVSCLPLAGSVRLLLGPDDTSFFGVSATSYEQIAIHMIGDGQIGKGGPFVRRPLR